MADDPKKRQTDPEPEPVALPERPRPPEIPQAMCYAKAAEPTTRDHVCRHCGARTQYPLKMDLHAMLVLPALPDLPGWKLELDAREFCRTCTPAAPEPPALVLVASHGGKETRTRGVGTEDVDLLQAYATRWLTRLRPVPRRVKVLLGID